jgi:hypothetical protein
MIEIVNFYPTVREDNKQFLQGSLHVYIVDLGIDLRGVFVSKKKDFWYFSLPMRIAKDDGKTVKYPIMSFRDRDKTNQLLQIIKEQGKPFIENYLKTNPQPIETAVPSKPDQAKPIQEKTNVSPALEKRPMSKSQSSSSFKIPCNEWVSLPPRPQQQKKQKYR